MGSPAHADGTDILLPELGRHDGSPAHAGMVSEERYGSPAHAGLTPSPPGEGVETQ